MNYVLLGVLAALNLWAFASFGADKRKARLNKPRTPESTLLLLAAVGGVLGAWLGVRVFRHKNRKKAFLVPLVIASVVAVLAWYTVFDLLWQSGPTA